MSKPQGQINESGRRRRVAYLTNMLLDWETRRPRFGGGEYYAVTLGRLLRDLGFDVTFYQAANEAFEGDYYGFKVIALPLGEWVSEFQPGVSDEFYRVTKDYDHVIHNIPTYASGLLRDDALVICHSVWFDHDNYRPPIEFRTPRWFEELYRAFSRPRRIVSVDTNVINVIRALWPELVGRMTYIPSFVDTDVFSPPERRAGECLTVLFPRRSEYTRGSRLLEPILKRVPHDCRFLWVGDGEPEETARIKALAESDRRLQFFAASFEEMPRFYQQADICVIPAVASEGTCLASLEALASGCAVVATNVGGLANIFQPGVNGLMTDVDAEQISAAINRLIEDPDERARLQEVGPQTARKFSLDIWRKRWTELLQEMGWLGQTKQKRTMTGKEDDSKQQRFYESLIINPDIRPEDVSYILNHEPSFDQAVRADVVCFSIINWEFRYQRPQQMMSQFAARGHRVFYIRMTRFNPPGAEPRVTVEQIKENIFDVTLTAAGHPDLYADVLAGAHLEDLLGALDELRRRYRIAEALSYVMIPSWGEAALAARERWGWQVIYDCMDEWEGFPRIGKSLIDMEARLVAASDLTVTTAGRLYEKWRGRGRKVVLARNAVDYEFYQQELKPNTLLADLKRPVIGYYGAIADWFDFELMREVAARRPEYSFVLIGGVFDIDTSGLQSLPNVRLLGQQPYEMMPKYLYHFDACMIPFQINHITEATDPVKLYEYLSGGKPVVSVALPEIASYEDLLYIARGPDEFVARLDQAVRENDLDLVERRKQFAASQTWAARYGQIMDGLAHATPRVSIIVVTRNQLTYTKLCLESLIRNTDYPNYEIIVVDNGSSDDTIAYLRYITQKFHHIKFIENEADEGFVRALNRGVDHSAGDYLVWVKPDTLFTIGWLSRLINHLRDTRVGLCSPATNYLGSETRCHSDYQTLDEMAACLSQWRGRAEWQELRRLTIFCAGLRREVFEKAGPPDAEIGEDRYEDDYAARLRAAGYEVVSAPDVFVHYFGKTAHGLRNILAEREHRIYALQSQLTGVESERTALRQATTRMTADLRDAELERDSLALQLEKERQANERLRRELGERDAELARKQVELESKDAELTEKQELLVFSEKALDSLNAQVAEEEKKAASFLRRLNESEARLERMTSTLGWRILSLYGPIKYRYLLPIYRMMGFGPRQDRARAVIMEQQPARASSEIAPPAAEKATSPPPPVAKRKRQQVRLDLESNAYDVICFPIIEWHFRFQRPQQLMSQFARSGHRVFYISQKFGAFEERYRVREITGNVYEVTLRGPQRNVYEDILDDAARDELFDSLDRLRRDLSLGATVSVVQLPFWWPLAGRARDELNYPVVYDCMDHHAGFSTNLPDMLTQEAELLSGADLVIASSAFLDEQARKNNSNVLLLRNGCDYEHFAKARSDARAGRRPVIGYYGAIADWFDSDLVADLAEKRKDWDFILVGSTFTADTDRLSKLPNVKLTGEKPYGEIPGWLARFDVAVIPFKRIPLTEATNPVKAYEILASGKPLVSVPLPEVAPLAPLVRLASSVEEFEREIGAALAEDDPALAESRMEFARTNTWEDRFRLLAPAIRESFPKVSIIVVTYNNAHLNRLCLESIYARTEWPNFEVIVVDNASSDETPEYLEQAEKSLPDLRVILNKSNLGFASANNQALKEATGEYLVLLNNDTVVTRGWLSALIKHLNADPDIGLIGPVTNEIGNEAKVPVGYERLEEMPDWAAVFVRENDGQTFSIPVLAMFCVAMRRDVFARVGALDESFQIGMFEDDDYTRRVREEGLKVVCARDSFIHHAGRASFKLLGEQQYLEVFQKNRKVYEEKWGMWEPHLDEKDRKRVGGLRERLNRIIAESGVDRSRIVIFLPSIGWDTPLVQRPHHLAAELARQGFLVFFDCAGSVIDHFADFVPVEKNLWLYRGPKGVLDTIERPILWTLPYNAHLVNRWARRVIVYDWIDDLSVFPYRQSMLLKNHESMLEKADLVLYVARKLESQMGGERADALYVPNGVEYARFASGSNHDELDSRFKEMVEEGRPVIGYYGAIASWLDAGLLSEVAEQRKDWSFVLIGQKLPDAPLLLNLARKENVLILRSQPYETLPSYLSRLTAAMIPFKINRITEATSPLKLYEYFAGGKPVISTPMPECQAFEEVLIARDAGEFSRALDEAKARSADASFKRRLQEIASENSWEVRVKTVVRALKSEVAERGEAAKASVRASSETRRESAVVTRERTPRPADEIADRFRALKNSSNQYLFDALTEHFASISSDPDLASHFEYAIRCNERGRQVAEFFGERFDLNDKSYLEIGCTYGGGLVAMAERGAEVTGFESDGALLRLAAENLIDNGIDAQLLSRDTTQASELSEFRESFDIINSNQAIKQVLDPQAFVRNVADMLRDGGVAYFEMPGGEQPREMFERAGLAPEFIDEGPNPGGPAVLLARKGRS